MRALFVDRYPVTVALMRETLQWAFEHDLLIVDTGGVFNAHGEIKRLLPLHVPGAPILFTNDAFEVREGFHDRPVTHVTWYGALAFCNFRSAMAGLPEAVDFADWSCDFDAAGYRLPSEQEWELAARGGLDGQRFPWDSASTNLWDNIDGDRANFWASGHPYANPADQYLTPVGFYDNPNPLNLYDMAGNVYEWCWDWYQYGAYSNVMAGTLGYAGPTNGLTRVTRGGAWCDTPDLLRAAHRSSAVPRAALPFIGFRCVRNF
jgi:formylglycine-generating enzyme